MVKVADIMKILDCSRLVGLPGTAAALRLAVIACAALIAYEAFFPRAAYAYIDPGSGSFIIQGIIAGLLGAGVTLKLLWKRITARFSSSQSDDEKLDD